METLTVKELKEMLKSIPDVDEFGGQIEVYVSAKQDISFPSENIRLQESMGMKGEKKTILVIER
jgi:hypothetical protein